MTIIVTTIIIVEQEWRKEWSKKNKKKNLGEDLKSWVALK